MDMRKHSCFLALCALLLPLFFLFSQPLSAQPFVPADLRGESIPFLPYLEYMIDENGSLGIEAVSLQDQSLQFLPLKPLDLDLRTGTFWLRFTIGSIAEGEKAVEWLLSLGDSLPGDPVLYVPEIQSLTGMQQWRMIPIVDRHILNLPEPSQDPKTCYIKMAGPPGLWFSPMLRSPHNAANNWGSLARPATLLGLFVIMLISLLRSFSEHGQWRIWTVLFVGSALAAGYLGLPTMEKGHIGLNQFASALAPGLSLMLLAHVARHLMRSHDYSRIVDAQLILLTLVGAAVTLLPLVPGLNWTARFLELWPLGTLFFIPTALWALFLALPASQRFLLICIFPPLFTAIGLLGLLSGLPADFLAACPLEGIALSALMLVAAPNPPLPEKKKKKQEEMLLLHDETKSAQSQHKTKEEPLSLTKPDPVEEPLSLIRDSRLSQPLSMTVDAPKEEHLSLKEESSNRQELPVMEELPKESASSGALHAALQNVLDIAHFLEENPAPQHIRELVFQCEKLASIIHMQKEPEEKSEGNILNLEFLLRDTYNNLQEEALSREIALGWYMPPNLHLKYMGHTHLLEKTFRLLAESAVAATSAGSVHFTVQQYPNSSEPGHLLFTLQDTGSDLPEERSFAGLQHAYELARLTSGEVQTQSGPRGSVISFSVHMKAVEEANLLNSTPLVLVVSQDVPVRTQVAQMLKMCSCRVLELGSLHEAQSRHQKDAAILVIIHGPLASPSISKEIGEFQKVALAQGLPFCKILAITKDKSNWKQLGAAGFIYALLEPVQAEALCTTVNDVIDTYSENKDSVRPVTEVPQSQGTILGDSMPSIAELMGLANVINSFSHISSQRQKKKAEETRSAAALSEPPKKESVPVEKSQPVAGERKQTVPAENPQTVLVEKKQTLQARPNIVQHAASMPASPPLSQGSPREQWILSFGSGRIPQNLLQRTVPPQKDVQAHEETSKNTPKNSSPNEKEDGEEPIKEFVAPKPVESKEPERKSASDPLPDHTVPSKPLSEDILREADKIAYEDEWVGEPAPVPSKSSTEMPSKPLSKHILKEAEEIAYEDEWVGEPVPVPSQNRAKPTPSSFDAPKRDPYPYDDEWVGEPVPVPSQNRAKSTPSSFDAAKRDPYPYEDEWVGEPTPVPSQNRAKSTPSSFDAPKRDPYPYEDEWVGEPTPIPSQNRAKSTPSSFDAPKRDPYPYEDEWVGEPTPVPSQSSKAMPSKLLSEDILQEADKIAFEDEWVGEPTPVPQTKSRTPQEDSSQKPGRDASHENGTQKDNAVILKPEVLAFLKNIDEDCETCRAALQANECGKVADAAGHMAKECDSFGFRLLARMARCVEQAGRAGDKDALNHLFPELLRKVEDNRMTISQFTTNAL